MNLELEKCNESAAGKGGKRLQSVCNSRGYGPRASHGAEV